MNNQERSENLAAFMAFMRRGGGWYFAQSIDGKKRETHWIAPGAPFAYPDRWQGKSNVYFGVNQAAMPVTADDREKYPGKADRWIMTRVASKNDTICAVNALIAEFDGKDYTNPNADEIAAAYAIVAAEEEADYPRRLAASPNAKPLPPASLNNKAINLARSTKYATDPALYNARAYDIATSTPKKASVLVFSGGGYQAYWLLTETYHIATEDQRAVAEDAQKRFCVAMGGDQAVNDLRRVLRVPGTYNVKTKYAPNYPLCDFVWCELDRTFSLAGLLADCPATTATAKRTATRQSHTATPSKTEAVGVGNDIALSLFALRVAYAHNANNTIRDALRNAGYGDVSRDRMHRPGGENGTVLIDDDKNASYHFGSDDPLHGDHLRRPFDVVAIYDHGGEYEAAAVALAATYGIETPADMARKLAYYQRLVTAGNWKRVIPINRQSAIGYMTGDADRKLFDNLLAIMERAGKTIEVCISYRQMVTATAADGCEVVIAGVASAKRFVERIVGVLVTCRQDGQKVYYTLCEPKSEWDFFDVVATRNSSLTYSGNELFHLGTTSNNDHNIYRQQRGSDAFARGRARWAREVIDAEKQVLMSDNPDFAEAARLYAEIQRNSRPANDAERRALMGDKAFADYRQLMSKAADNFLPSLGTYGLLVLIDLIENPNSTRKDIAQRRGLSFWAVGKALRKLEEWGAVDSLRDGGHFAPATYFVNDTVFDDLAQQLTTAATYKIGSQRLADQLETAHVYAEKRVALAGDDDARRIAEKQSIRLANRRHKVLAAMFPYMTGDEIADMIAQAKIAWRKRTNDQHAAEPFLPLDTVAVNLHLQGIPTEDIALFAQRGGYDKSEAAHLAWLVHDLRAQTEAATAPIMPSVPAQAALYA